MTWINGASENNLTHIINGAMPGARMLETLHDWARQVNIPVFEEPTDFGDTRHAAALVLVTNACNLRCQHCFVYREETPNEPRDKMSDEKMLYQLRRLRDKHGIRSMLFMGGEPMIKSELVFKAMKLFELSSIVTNGTYGIPSLPGQLVTVSLDGPKELNDQIRGEGVFEKVKQSIHEHNLKDDTTVMLQMTVTRSNAGYMEQFVSEVEQWPISGIAFTFYVPDKGEVSELAWDDLKERDEVLSNLLELKRAHPSIKSNVETLRMMFSDRALSSTGVEGENCSLKKMLPLYVGDGGRFERTFCCYGNNVDCSRCGAYGVFNSAYHRQREDRLNGA
jgi:MoaA/NifB/PqqE/SkfB family radical SAM enzyme